MDKPLMPRVEVVSPSNPLNSEQLLGTRMAADWARRQLGWEVHLSEGLADRHQWGGAGSPARRAHLLEVALQRSDLVMCSGGGDHAAELIPHLPSRMGAAGAFIGTSDNSMLAMVLAGRGVQTFCGPDLKLSSQLTGEPEVGAARSLDFSYTQQAMRGVFGLPGWREISDWSGECKLEIPLSSGPSGLSQALRPGDACGQLLAVNRRCLLKLAGTPWWPRRLFEDAILLIEKAEGGADRAVAELVALQQCGALDQANALCLGWLHGFDRQPEENGLDQLLQAALDLTEASGIPVHRLGVFGHWCPHALLPIGAPARLSGGRLWVDWPKR